MRPRLPPLNALKAFEAAARHESFTRAAEELCVTQGAVSHQVKALEAELAVKLFNRERQRLLITEAGRDYLAVIRHRPAPRANPVEHDTPSLSTLRARGFPTGARTGCRATSIGAVEGTRERSPPAPSGCFSDRTRAS